MLPDGYLLRRPTMDDLVPVTNLLIAHDICEYGVPDTDESYIRYEFAKLSLDKDVWLVTASGGQAVGYATVEKRAESQFTGDFYVHPDHFGRGIGTWLIRQVEGRVREQLTPGAPGTLSFYANGYNEAAARHFAREGYRPVRYWWRMGIKMQDEPAAPRWPDGIRVRTFVPGRDERATFEAFDESFQGHFGHIGNFERFLRRTTETGFDPGIWFLAEDGDVIAGVCLCRYHLDEGWVGSLGVREPWRGRGLGRALLLHTLREFYRRGRRTVVLGVDSQNASGATRLYESVGMQVIRRYTRFDRELAGPQD